MKPSAILFDMDGLMFDTERLSDELWIAVGARHGAAITSEQVNLLRGKSREGGKATFIELFGADFPYDECADEVIREMTQRLAVEVPLRPGLMELLNKMKAHGIPAAVASSTHRALVESNLRVAGVDGYFKAVVCGDDVSISKPAPDIFVLAAQRLGVDPAACLVLEDSHNGVRAGAAAGCRTIMIPDTEPCTPAIQKLTWAVMNSLSDVADLLF